jgi:hypothetical protein
MHTNTRATSTIFVLLVVTATSLLIISSNTMAGLAARSDLSHNSGKRHEQSKTNGIGSVSDNNNTQSAIDNTPSATSNNENPNLDTLLACESGAANGSGHITMSEVMNCYLQFSRGSASSLSILGDNQNSDRTGSGSGSGSASDHHVGSTKMNLSSHHQGSANHVSHGEIPAPTD